MNETTLLSRYYEEFHVARKKTGTSEFPGRLDFFRNEVGTGKKVVDLGCRFGDLLHHCAHGNDVLGWDIDEIALRSCHERFGCKTQVVNLNGPLPSEDGAFDVAILSEVLEHLPYPHITLKEVRRIIKTGGKLVGSVPNGLRFPNRLRFLLTGRVELDPTHLHHFGVSTLRQLLASYFSEVELRPVAGRLVKISPHWFANQILFVCVV